MATTKKRASGKPGKHKQPAKILRQFWPGQFDLWDSAAETAGQTFTDWARTRLDSAAKLELKKAT